MMNSHLRGTVAEIRRTPWRSKTEGGGQAGGHCGDRQQGGGLAQGGEVTKKGETKDKDI